MSENFRRSLLKVVIAHCSQSIGFDSSQNVPLAILSDVLENFLCQLGRSVHDLMEECSHANPNLNDVFESFDQNDVSILQLKEYLQQMDTVDIVDQISCFPRPKSSNFQFPNLGHLHELKHVFSYSPSILHATENLKQSKKQIVKPWIPNPLYTIAGKQDVSDDDDDIASYASDVSLESEARSLTKPEDIPVISGIAASSINNLSTEVCDDSISANVLSTSQSKFHGEHQTQISTGTEDLKEKIKNEEPLWVQQHAAKLEKETFKAFQTSAPIGSSEISIDNSDSRKSHMKNKMHKHSLWDSPIFSRKQPKSPPTTEPFNKDLSFKKSASVNLSMTIDETAKTSMKQTKHKVSITSRIEEVERLLKDPIVQKAHGTKTGGSEVTSKSDTDTQHVKETEKMKMDNVNPAFPSSIDDAINAVVHRASKEAEEAELMKFSHLIKDSSSSDEERVSYKTEQMLQLEKRGLQKHLEDESPTRPPLTPSPALSTNSLIIDQDMELKTQTERTLFIDDPSAIYTSDDSTGEELKWNLSSKELSNAPDQCSSNFRGRSKVDRKDKTEKKNSGKVKKKVKNKGKFAIRSKFDAPTSKVQKLVLKTCSGTAKVIKSPQEKDGLHETERMRVPKLSASVSLPVISKEKKKEKKEKKKRKKNRDMKNLKEEAPIPKLTFKVTPSAHHVSIVQPSKTGHPVDNALNLLQTKKLDAKTRVERKVMTQTISVASAGVGIIIDAQGNRVWICPSCNKPDDGSPMIGCDECDGWHHWPCVGISQEPPESDPWFCPSCAKQKTKNKEKKRTKQLK